MASFDIHDYAGRLVRALRILREDSELIEENGKLILEFVNYCEAQGLEAPTIVRHIFGLRKVSKILKKNFREASKEDLVQGVAEIERSKSSDDTKRNEKILIKRFYKWLNGDSEFPEQVEWIKTKRTHNRRVPENLVTEEEVKRLAQAAQNERDRALVLVLYETGARMAKFLV